MTSAVAKKASKTSTAQTPEVSETPEVPEVPQSESATGDFEQAEDSESESSEGENRIPEALNVPVLSDFCRRYLSFLDEAKAYNKSVLAEKDSQWTAAKLLEKARELARPKDKDIKADTELLSAIDAYESLAKQVAETRQQIVNITAGKMGIQLSTVVDRNPELESQLKEKRRIALEIGNQLLTISKMTTDENAANAVQLFLDKNPLPAVGREQVRNFSTGSSNATPKYRVTVEVSKDDKVLLTEDGFTKAALGLTKLHERGKAPKAEKLRQAWEAAGNTPDETKNPVVEFENEGLHYKITKK